MDDIRFCGVTFPVRNLIESVEEENSFSLGTTGWFHNPNIFVIRVALDLLELVSKDHIFCWKNVGLRVEVVAE